jgi:hypothetical protein
LDAAFTLPYRLAVPDLLYERELRTWDGPVLTDKGLMVLSLEASVIVMAQDYRRRESRLSLPDAFALALAKSGKHILLAGDASLRVLADAEEVTCHGVLWVFDIMYERDLATAAHLHAGLSTLASHPRCRLPKVEVQRRLDTYRPE